MLIIEGNLQIVRKFRQLRLYLMIFLGVASRIMLSGSVSPLVDDESVISNRGYDGFESDPENLARRRWVF